MARSAVRYDRVERGRGANVATVTPSATGGDLARHRMRGTRRIHPGMDREPRAIKCFHCGFPIKDYAAISQCPVCESDNVTGRKHRGDH